MLLRALVAAARGPNRRRIVNAVDGVDSLVHESSSIEGIESELSKRPFDLLVLEEATLEGVDGKWIEEIRSGPQAPEVVILTASDSSGTQARFLAAGCAAALHAAIDSSALNGVLESIATRRRAAMQASRTGVPNAGYALADYATQSPVMQALLKSAKKVADRDATLLILGETGVGKGLLARSMHNESPRSDKPFVSVNCGSLSDALLESELFGHERGAFTGADCGRRGHFEMAHTGSIFLDEVGDLPPRVQAKLLQVLEDRFVQPLGAESSIQVDVRIMAATNKDLAAEVEARRFREDLYYRLNVITLTLPPLRNRREDIPELAKSYVDHFRLRMGSDVKGVSSDALTALLRYGWPGNLREFINAIERAMIMTSEDTIQVADLPMAVQEFAPRLLESVPAIDVASADEAWLTQTWSRVRRQVLEETELRYLTGLLRETDGRIGETATRAGMDPRSVREKMRRYGLKKEDFR